MQELKYQFQVIQAIRNFFNSQGFMDIMTPPMVQNPGMETHIHPFEVYSKVESCSKNLFLHTSPEFHMKRILGQISEFNNIFTLTYCFRDEPISNIHRNQFIMCEWYRTDEHYTKIMDDCEQLISFVHHELKKQGAPVKKEIVSFKRQSIQDLFKEYLDMDILDYLDTDKLIDKIKKDFPNVPLPKSKCEWDDYYFLLFLNEIEPRLKNIDYILLYDFPCHLSALSTLNESDPRVCERFEIYINGIELCNCFNELTDLKIQKQRFDNQSNLKKKLYNYSLPEPNEFYHTLERGYPKSSGIALGVERLALCLLDIENPFFD